MVKNKFFFQMSNCVSLLGYLVNTCQDALKYVDFYWFG